jgi:hypothetical protein
LSFWSSAVTDCLAMGIPTIEYHKFHIAFGQTVDNNGALESFYSCLGLTKNVNSEEALRKILPLTKTGIANLYNQQRPVLDEVFSNVDQGFDNFTHLMDGQKVIKSSSTKSGKMFIYFFLKFIFRKIKPV